MFTQETRGYLLGKNRKGNFVLPEKLMDKITSVTNDTILMIWRPNKLNLKIINIENEEVTKIKVSFQTITQTVYGQYLTPIIEAYSDQLIYESGVQFPKNVDGDVFIEYYMTGSETDEIKTMMDKIKAIDEVRKVTSVSLSRFSGD